MANCRRLLLPQLLILSVVSAFAQLPLNVDCGTTGKTAGYLSMTWVGDEQYVTSGQSATVRIDHNRIAPLTTLRYFPDQRKKNCYSFPGVGQGIKILVRTWFYYGNYDGLSSPPTFDLLFNGNPWATVSPSGDNGSAAFEMVHVTKVEDVSVCLARTKPNAVPFINSLEIKKLEDDMYASMDTDRPLYVNGRFAYASTTVVRYPDDPYDRLWFPFTNYSTTGLSPVRRSSDPISNLADRPPAAVLRQAITPSSSLASNMTVPSFIGSPSPAPHYVTFYFVEMLANASRSFDIYLDDQKFYAKTIVPDGTVLELQNPNISLSTSSVFSLVRAKGSTLPPSISAAEFYMIGPVWGVAATDSSDVKALSEFQKSYVQLQPWSGDPCLPIGYAWEWLNCSSDSIPRVTALFLSGYGLTGPLADFSNLTALQIIDLHNNSLSGSIHEFLGKLPNLKRLNLADNQFNGSLPASLITSNSIVNLNISGNNFSGNSSDFAGSAEKKGNVGVIAGGTIGSTLFLLLLVMLAIFIFKKRPANASAKPRSALLEPEIKQHGFSHAEIVEITNNFEKVLGEGGSGNVYYGRLRNGSEVAVKVLKDTLSQGTKEFVAEAKLLMTVHHRFLVSFVGYCEEGGNLILLYEYMGGGNLRQLLSGRSSTSAFITWEIRLKIALRVATGLDYLHSGCYPPIIHRDVKTTNILLNAKMEAKVADFGLSKSGQKEEGADLPTVAVNPRRYSFGQRDDVTQVSTAVAGTPGYIDPEYYRTNRVTQKSDVYSFGVVLLELITGRPPIFAEPGERFHIIGWVTPRIARREIHSIADPKLNGQYNVNSMWKVADVALSCTSETSDRRPSMIDVVNQLNEALEVETSYQQLTDTPSSEVRSSPTFYEFSSSSLSSSYLPSAR
ncbi:putative leucine-rich repeat receptor-like serine/threonine-protein kinase At2g04300 isoform X2 [Nymphaea colorata]|uniref:putative leucine-rich repeat receptor-like serine/threonine-protein kinase At2g04300 isoform X2 n=1 Tax=Nymphaea colorata TaxID=210225 RepID=UPI00129ED33E|nr:putative leucine-rich repeat receptor-like serine/threonine-protein kinase At2g04300 isoform X2 [Nymphaea colorata]